MEDGMDSREILQILWRGKYFVMATTAVFAVSAVLYVLFAISPVYQCSSLVDMTPYKIKNNEMIALIEQDQVVASAVKGLNEDDFLLAEAAELSTVSHSEFVLTIKMEHADPDVCAVAVKQIGQAIIQSIADYRSKQISRDTERYRELIAVLDKAIAEYLVQRDTLVVNILEEDPIYRRFLEEKGNYLVKAKILEFELGELTKQSSEDIENWPKDFKKVATPVPVNKKLYIVFSVLLGLMLSVFVLFVRHYCIIQGASSTRVE